MAEPTIKEAGEGWTWFSEYVYAWAQWTLNCPPDRTCQVGMGVMAFGSPLGEKIRFSGHLKITTLGIGSIHVRAVDGKGPCTVRLDAGDVGLVPLPTITFP